MYPASLLEDTPWSFSDSIYESSVVFLKDVNDCRSSLELGDHWNSDEIAINVERLTVLTEEVYDKNDEEVDLSFEIVADGQSFTNGELLLKLHNAYAEKMIAGYQFGDHCFFEGLTSEDVTKARYNCFLGS